MSVTAHRGEGRALTGPRRFVPWAEQHCRLCCERTKGREGTLSQQDRVTQGPGSRNRRGAPSAAAARRAREGRRHPALTAELRCNKRSPADGGPLRGGPSLRARPPAWLSASSGAPSPCPPISARTGPSLTALPRPSLLNS